MTSDKSKLLERIAVDIVNDNICLDLAEQATQLVLGAGNPDADVVFIGEAPGKQEDIQGKPFVGASGRFLDEMLASVGMSREDIYITNIVKYRPPNNRDPLPEEKKAFWPYLVRQLDVIQPKVLVTLGRHSGSAFLPELKISQDHGKPKRLRLISSSAGDKRSSAMQGEAGQQVETTLIILPLYHPAAALYNGGMRETLLADFASIPQLIKDISKKKEK